MKFSFYFSLVFLISYLVADVSIINYAEQDRPIVQLLAGVSLIAMLFYNIIYIKRLKKQLHRWRFLLLWGFMLLLICLYYIMGLFGVPSKYAGTSIRNLVVALYIFTTIFFIYNARLNNHLKGNVLKILIGFLIINGIISVYHAVATAGLTHNIIKSSSGYVFVMILPLLMYEYKKENLLVFGITLVLTLTSSKRGALVIYLVLLFYFLINYREVFKQYKITYKTFAFFVVVLGLSYFFAENAITSLLSRVTRVEHVSRGQMGSGRILIWSSLLNFWNNGIWYSKIFGFGYFATDNIYGKIAHNDFIEYLVDYGIVGFCMWNLTLIKMYFNIKPVKKQNRYLYILIMSCFIILLLRGIFAGTIRTDNINLSISLGYLLGIYELRNYKDL